MAEIVRRSKPKPQKAVKAPRPAAAARLRPADFRVPEEPKSLLMGGLVSLAIAVIIPLLFFVMFKKLPEPANVIVPGIAILWVLAPHGYVLLRGMGESGKYRKALAMPLVFPPTRTDPQLIVTQIAALLGIRRELTVVLVPGKPALVTLGTTIIMTEGLYSATIDRDLQVLLLHEIAHHFCGHSALLPYAKAVPTAENDPVLRAFFFPALFWFVALEQWMLWADVSADRLVLLVKLNVDLAILGVIKETALMSPDSESRTHLLRFLTAGEDALIDRGEQFAITTEINSLLHAHPDAESRIANIRDWRIAESFEFAARKLRESVEPSPQQA
jgi:Zn-dependent protease with chaperone function